MTPKNLAYKLLGYKTGYPPEKFNTLDALILKDIDKDIELIQQACSEWCKDFISWYAKKHEMNFTDEFKNRLIEEFLNTSKS